MNLSSLPHISNSKWTSAWLYPLIILALVLMVYGFTVSHDYNIDDGFYMQTMPEDGSSFRDIISVFDKDNLFSEVDYRPVTSFLLASEQFFFGRSPHVFHLFNLVYYWLLGICMYLVFSRFDIFRRDWHVLLFVSLFLLHPSHANVVSSIKNRDLILATMFSLLGSWYMYKFFISNIKFAARSWYLAWTVFWGFAAVLTKIDSIFIFLIPPLIVFYKRQNLVRVIIATALSLLAIIVFREFHSSIPHEVDPSMSEFILAGFSNPLEDTDKIAAIFEMQAKGFWHYLNFQIVPTNYYFYFGFDMIPLNGYANVAFIGGMVSAILLVLAALFFYWKRSLAALGLGIAIFLVLTLPYVIFIHEVAGIVAVRYGFYGSIGFSLALTALLTYLYKVNQKAGVASTVIICLLFAFFSISRAMDWKDHITLYTKDIPKLERSYIANRMVGEWYLNEIEFHTDEAYLDQLLRKSKKYNVLAIGLYGEDPITLKRMGDIYTYENNADSAYYYYAMALEQDPDRSANWKSMAQFAIQTENYELLEMTAEGLLDLDSLDLDGIALMNDALSEQAKFEKCLEFNRNIMELDNSLYAPYLYSAKIYEDQGDRSSALINYFEAFKRGFIDERLQSSLVDYVRKNNLDDIKKRFPAYF
ncbi:MAG: hypothetical protein GY751_11315 [Bacteroidetes bacterium]|nr:hypothetical protein [Bacteroidota bacterium]